MFLCLYLVAKTLCFSLILSSVILTVASPLSAEIPSQGLGDASFMKRADTDLWHNMHNHKSKRKYGQEVTEEDQLSHVVFARSPKVELSTEDKHQALSLFMMNEKIKQRRARQRADGARVHMLRAGLEAAETKYNILYVPGYERKDNMAIFREAQRKMGEVHKEHSSELEAMRRPGINIENIGRLNKDLRDRMLKNARPHLNEYPELLKRPDSALAERRQKSTKPLSQSSSAGSSSPRQKKQSAQKPRRRTQVGQVEGPKSGNRYNNRYSHREGTSNHLDGSPHRSPCKN